MTERLIPAINEVATKKTTKLEKVHRFSGGSRQAQWDQQVKRPLSRKSAGIKNTI